MENNLEKDFVVHLANTIKRLLMAEENSQLDLGDNWDQANNYANCIPEQFWFQCDPIFIELMNNVLSFRYLTINKSQFVWYHQYKTHCHTLSCQDSILMKMKKSDVLILLRRNLPQGFHCQPNEDEASLRTFAQFLWIPCEIQSSVLYCN